MGDWFETVAVIDVTEDEAPAMAAAVLDWLVGEKVVVAEKTDCVLSSGGGHAPGANFGAIVSELDPSPFSFRTNGLQLDIGRGVYFSMEADHVVCPHCGAVTRLGARTDAWEQLSDRIDLWAAGKADSYDCTFCGRSSALNDWQWTPPWAFGELGFTFWNWPRLRDDFVAELSERLGRRAVRPFGQM
jgi:hypothetical protein